MHGEGGGGGGIGGGVGGGHHGGHHGVPLGGPPAGAPGGPAGWPPSRTGFLPPIDPGAYDGGRTGARGRRSRAGIAFVIVFALLFITVLVLGMTH